MSRFILLITGYLQLCTSLADAATINQTRNTLRPSQVLRSSNGTGVIQPKVGLAWSCFSCTHEVPSYTFTGPPPPGETDHSRQEAALTTMLNMHDWVLEFEDPHLTRHTVRNRAPSDQTLPYPLHDERLGGIRGGWVHSMNRDARYGGPRIWTTRFEASRATFDELARWWRRHHFWSNPRRIEVIWHLETVRLLNSLIYC